MKIKKKFSEEKKIVINLTLIKTNIKRHLIMSNMFKLWNKRFVISHW